MPLFAPGFEGEILDLTITLSQILFPILILLGISGVVVGILNSYDRFGAFAISSLFWNLTIIAVVVLLAPAFHGQDRIYAYAIGILVGTLVQLMIPTFDLRNTPFKFEWSFEWRNPDVRRVLLLMLPVTISLGLINFNMLINSLFGSLVSDQSPAAIDKAFRIYQLPQGIFSVAIATVLFPTLARFAARGEIENLRATMANGMRQILFVLVPAAAAVLVLSTPMIRLVYQRGEFTPEQTDPGRHRPLLVRLHAADQRPLPAADPHLLQPAAALDGDGPGRRSTSSSPLSAPSVLYKPFGTAGIVAGTGIGTTAAVVAQAMVLRREFDGLELRRLFGTATKITIASAALAAVSFGVWDCSTASSGAASSARSSRSVSASGWAVWLPRDGEAAPDRRAGADHAAPAAALDARGGAVSAGGRRAWLLVGFAWLGAAAARGAGARTGWRPGATGDRGACDSRPALGCRAPRDLWLVRAGAVSGCRGRRGDGLRLGWEDGGGVPPRCWVFRQISQRGARLKGEKDPLAGGTPPPSLASDAGCPGYCCGRGCSFRCWG